MSDILSRCRPRDTSKFVLATLANTKEILTPESKANMIHVAEFDSIESCRSSLRKNLSSYYSKSGVLLFVYSVLLTRGVELVRSVQTHHQQQLNPNNNARKNRYAQIPMNLENVR